MTKVELVRAISKKTGVEQPLALACVEAAMEAIKETKKEGDFTYFLLAAVSALKILSPKLTETALLHANTSLTSFSNLSKRLYKFIAYIIWLSFIGSCLRFNNALLYSSTVLYLRKALFCGSSSQKYTQGPTQLFPRFIPK